MEKLPWTNLKVILDTVNPPLYSIKEDSDFINIFFLLQGVMFDCDLSKVSPDYIEFQSKYRSRVNLKGTWDVGGRQTITSSPFSDASGFRFRGVSFKGEVVANTTQDIDYKLEGDRWINGGRAIIDNTGADDQLTFQVVDVDNILGLGSGVVLDEFIADYYVPQGGDLEVQLAYPAKVPSGLYIRLKYKCTHSSGCIVKCNLYLHWKAVQ